MQQSMDWQLQKFSAASTAGGIKGREDITSTQEPGPLDRGGTQEKWPLMGSAARVIRWELGLQRKESGLESWGHCCSWLHVLAGPQSQGWPGESACLWETEAQRRISHSQILLEKMRAKEKDLLSPVFLSANFYIYVFGFCSQSFNTSELIMCIM